MLNHVPLIICDDANRDDAALISAISEKWGFPVVAAVKSLAKACICRYKTACLDLPTQVRKK